jgi:hypothetical protein
MYDTNTDIASWPTTPEQGTAEESGTLTVNFETGEVADNLNHERISRTDMTWVPQKVYERIGFELLDDGHYGDYLPWAMDYTPDGKGVLFHIGGTNPTIRLHPDGVTFHPNGVTLKRVRKG